MQSCKEAMLDRDSQDKMMAQQVTRPPTKLSPVKVIHHEDEHWSPRCYQTSYSLPGPALAKHSIAVRWLLAYASIASTEQWPK